MGDVIVTGRFNVKNSADRQIIITTAQQLLNYLIQYALRMPKEIFVFEHVRQDIQLTIQKVVLEGKYYCDVSANSVFADSLYSHEARLVSCCLELVDFYILLHQTSAKIGPLSRLQVVKVLLLSLDESEALEFTPSRSSKSISLTSTPRFEAQFGARVRVKLRSPS